MLEYQGARLFKDLLFVAEVGGIFIISAATLSFAETGVENKAAV